MHGPRLVYYARMRRLQRRVAQLHKHMARVLALPRAMVHPEQRVKRLVYLKDQLDALKLQKAAWDRDYTETLRRAKGTWPEQ